MKVRWLREMFGRQVGQVEEDCTEPRLEKWLAGGICELVEDEAPKRARRQRPEPEPVTPPADEADE